MVEKEAKRKESKIMQTAIVTPITETYLDVEKLIYHVCNLFRRKHGGELEEMIGEANLVYMKVYKDWEWGKGMSFTSYLCTCIYRKLLTLNETVKRKSKVWSRTLSTMHIYEFTAEIRSVDDLGVMEDKKPTPFFIEEFLQELSEDAQTILQFVLEEHEEIKIRAEAKGGQYRNWRSTIKEYLKEVDWTARRISESFEEIRRAL